MSEELPDAWVQMPSEEELRAVLPEGMPYDFGFLPAMSRLLMAHPGIGPAFGILFSEIMFSEERTLTRREREMVAAVAASAQDCFY